MIVSDFVDYSNGKYSAGVVAFVSVSVSSLGLHREDVGYATTVSHQKGSAIYNARKVIWPKVNSNFENSSHIH